jgi:hypothetical protein
MNKKPTDFRKRIKRSRNALGKSFSYGSSGIARGGNWAIAQHRKILIPGHLPRLIKYSKVEEYIREIVQRK